MSYIRFGENSEIYMYPESEKSIVCMGCSLADFQHGDGCPTFDSRKSAIAHLELHRKAGHKGNIDAAIARLKSEINQGSDINERSEYSKYDESND